MRELCKRISTQEMTCCPCSRSYEVRVDAESSSTEVIVLPDTSSPGAHHLKETILFQHTTNRKHILWQKEQYCLARVSGDVACQTETPKPSFQTVDGEDIFPEDGDPW